MNLNQNTFYDIEKKLYAAQKLCSNEAGTHFNLVHLLIHELSHFFISSCARSLVAADKNNNNKNFLSNLGSLRFGFRNGKPINFDQSNNLNLKKRLVFFSFIIVNILSLNLLKRVYIGQTSFKFELLVFNLLKKGYLPFYMNNLEISFTNYEKQKEILNDLCTDLLCLIDASEEVKNLFNSDLNDFLSRLEEKIIIEDPIDNLSFRNDFLLIGSPGKFANRLLSFAAASRKLEVYGCLHGSECGAVDVPSWTYDDYSCCDHLLGYGPAGKEFVKLRRSEYVNFEEKGVNYIQSSCEQVKLIKEYFRDKKNHGGIKFKDARVLYVTTRIRGLGFINVDSIINPQAKIQFVKNFLKCNTNVDVKGHPKGQEVDYGVSPERVKSGELINLITQYDIIVMDSLLSTAFSLVAASNLPIVFFGPSSAGFSKEGWEQVKKRVYFYKIEKNSTEIPIEFSPHSIFSINKSSKFSETFSLSENADQNLPRLKILMKAM